MEKQIEMFEISDKPQPDHPVIGTQIFDPNLPSNIDFDQKQQDHEKSFINPQKKIPEMGKSLNIGTQLKSYRIAGKLTNQPQCRYHPGAIVNNIANNHAAKILDRKSSGLKMLWDSILGYCKRELMLQDGHVYILQRKGVVFNVEDKINLTRLLKVFVDPEEEKVRMVEKTDGGMVNWDIVPENFVLFVGMVGHELSNYGLGLSE